MSRSRSAPWVALVAAAGSSPAARPNYRYGSPDAYASRSRGSPESAAAIPISWADQSTYATARPSAGLMSDRSQQAGPKMNRALLGWLRPVFDPNAPSRHRLRPDPVPVGQ